MSEESKKARVKTGVPGLDRIIDDLRLGDNVVWKVDDIEDYRYFTRAFLAQSLQDRKKCVYLRFASHPPILDPCDGLEIIEVDPAEGFDVFSTAVHKIIENRGREVFYVFDNLSALAVEWATDELLAAFFQVTCPFLFELDTVAFFALTRGKHSYTAVARIRDTTQVLLSVFHGKNKWYIHPLKVWDRYSSEMFLPHEITDKEWQPVFHRHLAPDAAALASEKPLDLQVASIAPWDAVYRQLMKFRDMDQPLPESSPEVKSLKKEFSRMMLGSHPTFDRLVDQFLTVDDLFRIRNRLIGSGKIGGKAAGMLVARRILSKCKGPVNFNEVLEPHDSFHIGSDVFFTFLIDNNLFRLRLQLSENLKYGDEDYEDVQARFLDGRFPPEILEQFSRMLDYYGQAPIIVRSSSLLEDSFGNAFAGKYLSEFCVNQGGHHQRLDALVRAVKLIYASALSPDALSYRRKRGLSDRDEQMAILVQRVAGVPYKHFFFPSVAGVAMSRNLYVWTGRINPAKGMIRLVFGLGTRAVNRVGNDYPRMIAVSHPGLRPESSKQIPRYSQKIADVINVKDNCCDSLPVWEVADLNYPNLNLFVSEMKSGFLSDPVGQLLDGPIQNYVLTFNPLIERTLFVTMIDKALTELERVYRQPVEIEFTFSILREGSLKLNLLQCRPMMVPDLGADVAHPKNIPPEHLLFLTRKFLGGGIVGGIRYIIYVDPKIYAKMEDIHLKKSLGRVVGAVNAKLGDNDQKIIMIGPGRWGSSNIDLGVNVSYSDIDNAKAIVEVAYEESGQTPEVSYGTHFFLDLVESRILYLSVYPDEEEGSLNSRYLAEAPNALGRLLPEHQKFSDFIKVIDIPESSGGKRAEIAADPHSQQAWCYLTGS
ncbi:MAG: PEP/pyruvate-binding domain-containing protein [Candidatus Omnitrophota bacterium]|nr:PEP/pyruvate-binding domain-containing protein [Candidatus Omnitrophota bacterium]MDZ4242664.1 PEP/pyruvate-binding domain-containing protein [Candidatus Omnitrophota bacterium]